MPTPLNFQKFSIFLELKPIASRFQWLEWAIFLDFTTRTPFLVKNASDRDNLTLSQLEQYLAKAAWILKGSVNASHFKAYIFPLLFFKRISDVHAFHGIEKTNQQFFYGIFGDAQWSNKNRLSDRLLTDLVEHFTQHDLANPVVDADILDQAYEYVIKHFAVTLHLTIKKYERLHVI